MSITVLITNLSNATVSLTEAYCDLGPSGAANAAVTITRTVAQLDSMDELKGYVNAGTVSAVVTESTDNVDFLSIPLEQHGTVGALAVDAVAVVTHAVTFAKAFPGGVTPVISLSAVQGTHTDWKAGVYARTVTNTGFTIALDVTTQSGTGGEKGSVTWVATY